MLCGACRASLERVPGCLSRGQGGGERCSKDCRAFRRRIHFCPREQILTQPCAVGMLQRIGQNLTHRGGDDLAMLRKRAFRIAIVTKRCRPCADAPLRCPAGMPVIYRKLGEFGQSGRIWAQVARSWPKFDKLRPKPSRIRLKSTKHVAIFRPNSDAFG